MPAGEPIFDLAIGPFVLVDHDAADPRRANWKAASAPEMPPPMTRTTCCGSIKKILPGDESPCLIEPDFAGSRGKSHPFGVESAGLGPRPEPIARVRDLLPSGHAGPS